ncbi:MAG: RagB/SusD family nutrient uptake outer membrane protein [Bacteroidales bacterium]
MKTYKIFNKIIILAVITIGLSSCEDFLDCPTDDSYTIDTFYKTDEQCFQAANPLYNSPWYDFQRGFIRVGDALAGNYFSGTSGTSGKYMTFTLNSTDDDLVNMSASLWSVNAHCNAVIQNINLKSGPDVSEETKNTVKGEAMTMKALAYFYLVRVFGPVPIIYDNTKQIVEGGYNNYYKAPESDVYKYIIMMLEKAIDLLPEKNDPGRIDQYSAMGLLAKVYLTKSGLGMSGSRNQDDLDMAKEYAGKVIYESGRTLMTNYSDIFRIANNYNSEALISWQWKSTGIWTTQNSFQSDMAIAGFDETGANWGGYTGPTVDLQEAFGENALSLSRNNKDARRKATMMMYGDKYDYFWTDKGGFDWWDFCVNNPDGPGTLQTPTGASCVKQLVGDAADHAISGDALTNMSTSLSTHILRLADVYLIYAEATLGNAESTTDAKALSAFNAVRGRSVKGEEPRTSITFDDIWKERRLELAFEGDRWYDFVRLHYYKPAEAIALLKAQKRSSYTGLESYYKGTSNESSVAYSGLLDAPNITDENFYLPFPETDLTMNPLLMEDPQPFDFSKISL